MVCGTWKNPPYNTWTDEITFVSSYGATATPTWHLARSSANTSSNLVIAQRTNTNDLIITLGPLDPCQQPSLPRATSQGVPPHHDIPFSELLKLVDQGRVLKVVIQGSEIYGIFVGGGSFKSYVPSDTSLLQRLYDKDKNVSITAIAPPSNAAQPGCPPGVATGPLELTAAAMNQHNARVQANAIATSISGQTH